MPDSLQAEEKQVPALNKSRLALAGAGGTMARTGFAEAQSQREQRGLYSQKFPLHSKVFCWKWEQFPSCRAQSGRFEASWWYKVWSERLFSSCRGFQLPPHHLSSALIYLLKCSKLTNTQLLWTSLLENLFSLSPG